MLSDEEILAEERLSPDQELALYNLSLNLSHRGGQQTDMLLSKLQNNPFYQEMVDRGFLSYTVSSAGSSAVVANVNVTLKGLRYCVLYSDEIEPLRQHDISGVPRVENIPALADKHGEVDGDELVEAIFIPHMTMSSFPDRDSGFSLTDEQIEYARKTKAWRQKIEHKGSSLKFKKKSDTRTWTADSGTAWRYVVLDDAAVQIVGVQNAAETLRIPDVIEELPVISLAHGSLSKLEGVEEIACADGIVHIGSGAFRDNPGLKRLALPAQLAEFNPSWMTHCRNLEELELPGMQPRIERGVLASDKLKRLVIGMSASEVEPGAFQGSKLEEVVIDPGNPFLVTDGAALRSADGRTLVALACPIDELVVPAGCERIAVKCCHGFDRLERLSLPDTVTVIDDFAFSNTGLREFIAPPMLETIGAKAFLHCSQLREVVLNDGLESIGDSAFQGSPLTSLTIPTTVDHIGTSITRDTKIVHSGPHCTFKVDPRSKTQFYDNDGGLYRLEDEGMHLVQLIDSDKELYNVQDGTVAIDPFAFAYHDRLARVRIPDGVRRIGASAFRVCKKLAHVSLPDSVEEIGEEAFFDTNLEGFHVPAQLRSLGKRALVTEGAHTGRRFPSIASIDVGEGNEDFYLCCGMLCQRGEKGDVVVMFSNSAAEVVFPQQIVRVEDFAFSNAYGIEYLYLDPALKTIGTKGLATRCWIERIRVELAEPLEGRQAFEFRFPNTPGGIRGISMGLGGANWVHVPGIVEQLDICLANAHSYVAGDDEEDASAYEQTRLILDRFDDPFMLTNINRKTLERVLRNNIVDISVDVALHDDRITFDELVERGYVNPDNLDEIIERVTTLRDAATSAHLLETKRLMFEDSAFDYDL